MGSPVTVIGMPDIPHCSPMFRALGVMNVLVTGVPVSCQGHINTPHLMPVPGIPPCITHVGAIMVGSLTVRVSGLGMGRVGDVVGPLCTAVAGGVPNVLAGG